MAYTEDLTQFNGRKIILVQNGPDGTAIETEGVAESANEIGILFKPKGKTQVSIVEPDDIIEVSFVVETPKPLAAKVLKVVVFGQARAHLLERHAFDLVTINALTEDDAFDLHATIDHEATGLGHTHGEKSAAVAAVEAASV